ncbi:MAG: hypothetical protein WDN44_07060 [Sphingomonas sp.]
MDLEMELAVPAVREQPLLLRRHIARLVDRREILREHHAALEFAGARIGAAGEVDRSAVHPTKSRQCRVVATAAAS